jgi:glycosyltransferase involved in cell wall biosynthesis
MGETAAPLVSIGLPVRNGGETLGRVLEGLVGQSYARLEIIISDNMSTDQTEATCRIYAARDSRIRCVRQPALLSVMDNFRFVVDQSHGEFFMWAAHDDLRSPNYVAALVDGFRAAPGASLAASDIVEFFDYHEMTRLPRTAYDFETVGLGLAAQLRKQTRIGRAYVYGLIKSAYLREYPWQEDVSWDVIFLGYLAARGPFIHAPGATFYYRRDPARTIEDRARDTSFGGVRRWQHARTAWLTARATSAGHRQEGRWRPAIALFPVIFYFFYQGLRGIVASMTPQPLRTAWRRLAGSTRA